MDLFARVRRLSMLEWCLYSAMAIIVSVVVMAFTRETFPKVTYLLYIVTIFLFVIMGTIATVLLNEPRRQAARDSEYRTARAYIVEALREWAAGTAQGKYQLSIYLNALHFGQTSMKEKDVVDLIRTSIKDGTMEQVQAKIILDKLLDVYAS